MLSSSEKPKETEEELKERAAKRAADNELFASMRGKHCFNHIPKNTRCAISFTGGKDCHLAMQRAIEAGMHICCAIMFYASSTNMQAHRQEWQRIQCQAMNLPIVDGILLDVKDGDYKAAYAAAIRKLQQQHAIQYIVTGDIDFVFTSVDNFMQQVCTQHEVEGVQVLLPLWQQPRHELLQEMLAKNFDIRLACVKTPCFEDGNDWIGRRLDQQCIEDMQQIPNLDLTGENGEYHSMVVDGPMYTGKKLEFVDAVAYELLEHWGKSRGERWWVISKDVKLLFKDQENDK